MTDKPFRLASQYSPAGDQPQAIAGLVEGLQSGLAKQVLLGVTGSGKTFTMANVISAVQRPTLVLAHNKTLAAQLYGEMREFFPHNAVEYFVSYYDYYQPEAYVPSTDTYIEKDASINNHIEQMRLSATKALLERRDVVIVATVSAIYGLGDPEAYHGMVLHLVRGAVDQSARSAAPARGAAVHAQSARLGSRHVSCTRRRHRYFSGRIRARRGSNRALRRGDRGRSASSIRSRARSTHTAPRVTIYPKTHYVTPRETLLAAVEHDPRSSSPSGSSELREANKLVEAQRLEQRTRFDMEMILEVGYCTGIENYSRYLSGRHAGEPPPCLFDYLPDDGAAVRRRESRDDSAARRDVPRRSFAQGDARRVRLPVAVGARQPPAALRRVRADRAADDFRLGDAGTLRARACRPDRRAGRAARPVSWIPTSKCVRPARRSTTCCRRSMRASSSTSAC